MTFQNIIDALTHPNGNDIWGDAARGFQKTLSMMGPQPPLSPLPDENPTPTPRPQVLGARTQVQAQAPSPAPTASPQAPYTQNQYEQAIREFYANRGNPPISTMSGKMAELIMGNDKFATQPGIIAGIPINESSGGKNVTYENNPFNWGIVPQKNGLFSPASWDESLTKMVTGLQGRQKDFTATKGLDDWRNTGNLNSLGEWYAPKKSNPEHGGDVYGGRLNDYNNQIMEILRRISQQ